MSDFFDALDRYTKGNSKSEIVQGVISNVTGSTAMVRLSGSQQLVEAWYSKNAGLNVGDHCVLVRTNRSARWVVMGGFGTSTTGSAGDSENAASIVLNAGAGGSLAGTYNFGNSTSYATYFTVNINTVKTKSNVAAFFSGFITFQSSTNTVADVRMTGDGVAITSDVRVSGSSGYAATVATPVAVSGIISQAASGLHTFEVQAKSYSAGGTANDLWIVGASFFAMES